MAAQDGDDRNAPTAAGIPTRPVAPIVLRFFGCDAGMLGVNGDYFTVGDTPDSDIKLPEPLRGPQPCKLRFSRAAEGWRVSAADELPYFVNQQGVTGLSSLRSGDIVRLEPGQPGLQFSIMHQQAEPLAKLVARHAPRLLNQAPAAKGSPTPAPHADPASQTPTALPDIVPTPREEAAPRSWVGLVLLTILTIIAGVVIGGLLTAPSPPPETPGEMRPTAEDTAPAPAAND